VNWVSSNIGELAALLTAVFWTATSLAFETASRRMGTITVNVLRLFLASIFLIILNSIRRGMPLPSDANLHQWTWLSASGLVGFVLGDLFLFKSFTILSSRISMLIMTLVPPITALISFPILGEVLSPLSWFGMVLTVGGIGLAILARDPGKGRLTLSHDSRGLLYALIGAAGQAVGLVMSKYGMGSYDAMASTQIRLFAGLAGFIVITTLLRKWPKILAAIKRKSGLGALLTGSVFGPFLGVSFSLYAIQHTQTGIASTLMSITPVLIILPSMLIFKHKLRWPEVVGAFLSVAGVALFFI
jgi:drug/metabolite transporter (DMT)-like permease